MGKKIGCLIMNLLCFQLIGFAQGNMQNLQNSKLRVEILKKIITSEKVVFIDYSLKIGGNGQVSGVEENKSGRTPKNDSVFVIANIKLTNIQKKVLKLYPIQDLIAKTQEGSKSRIYINNILSEPRSFQKDSYKNGILGPFFYKLKQNESVTLDILVELPKNSDQLFIEYVK